MKILSFLNNNKVNFKISNKDQYLLDFFRTESLLPAIYEKISKTCKTKQKVRKEIQDPQKILRFPNPDFSGFLGSHPWSIPGLVFLALQSRPPSSRRKVLHLKFQIMLQQLNILFRIFLLRKTTTYTAVFRFDLIFQV